MGDVIPFRRRKRPMTEAERRNLEKALWPLKYTSRKPQKLSDFKPLSLEDAQDTVDAFFRAFPSTINRA